MSSSMKLSQTGSFYMISSKIISACFCFKVDNWIENRKSNLGERPPPLPLLNTSPQCTTELGELRFQASFHLYKA